MRYLILLPILLVFNVTYATEKVVSYQESLNQFMQQSKSAKSPFSADDMAVMEKAAASLARSMPDPGIKLGDTAPNFSLRNAFGSSVSLQDELKKGPVVLVFYRGAWCPFCNLHLHALQKNLPQFKQLGAQLITVTPQTPDKSAEQIKKDGLPFEVLSDLKSQVMKDYQLYIELPDDLLAVYKKHGLDIEAYNGKGRAVIPVPGTFVINQQGIVVAKQAETDYKKRMEPADILKVLKKL